MIFAHVVFLLSLAEYERVKGEYRITPAVLAGAKARCIVMHPLPRVDEISPEVDYDPRAVYFRQMKYGLYVRAALLYALLGGANGSTPPLI